MTSPAWWDARRENNGRLIENYRWSLWRLLKDKSIPKLEEELARIEAIKRFSGDRKREMLRGLYKWYIELKLP